MHLQAGQCGNQIGSKVRAPGAETGPRFVTCATDRPTDRLSKSDIAWMADTDDQNECGQRAATDVKVGREGSMSHSNRQDKTWKGNLLC